MKIKAILIMTLPLLALAIPTGQTTAAAAPDPTDSAESWRVVLDGVMGGRSSGRVSTSVSGNLLFTGDLSLENNGGFSQIRTATPEAAYRDAEGIQIRVRGDGRAYNFDLRVSNARMMAGAFQQEFQTLDGQWLTLQLPFDEFRLYSFGRRVRNAIALSPSMIESVGVTLSDKNEGSFRLEISEITPYGENVSPAPSSNPGIEIEAFSDEATAANNRVERSVQVVNERINVLCIEGSARWEFRYLRAMLKRDPRINATFVVTHAKKSLAQLSSDYIERFKIKSLRYTYFTFLINWA